MLASVAASRQSFPAKKKKERKKEHRLLWYTLERRFWTTLLGLFTNFSKSMFHWYFAQKDGIIAWKFDNKTDVFTGTFTAVVFEVTFQRSAPLDYVIAYLVYNDMKCHPVSVLVIRLTEENHERLLPHYGHYVTYLWVQNSSDWLTRIENVSGAVAKLTASSF